MWILSERKRKLMANLQKLMKQSAVDCKINEYENLEDELQCITLPGNPLQYAYHPVLARDIAETASSFRKSLGAPVPTTIEEAEEMETKPTKPSALEALRASAKEDDKATPLAPSAPVVPRPKQTVKATIITYKGKKYLSVPNYGPVGGKKDKPLIYDLYEDGDVRMSFKLGTISADPVTGKMTKDIVLSV